MTRSALLIGLAHLTIAIANAQNGEPPRVRIPRVSRAPHIEDYLGPASRHPGLAVTDFRQREPGDGTPASEPTTAYLSYDEKNFYAVFVCKDEPERIRAHMSKREDAGNDDSVTLYLDTFHDGQHAYVFSANPLGIQSDSILTEGSGTDGSFDTLWYTQGRLTGDGYIVSMSIPFKSLRFSGANFQTWGVALGRSILRNSENSFWPNITLRKQGFVSQMGAADGLENISPGRNIQLIPYVEGAKARVLDYGLGHLSDRNDFRAGLDSKVVLRNALTLDVTLNPDFSQVESDDPQVTINQRYEVYFPEKRPFFIENASYFQTPLNLFFSRRIVDPEVGVRLTGKLGPWVIGLLGTDDRAGSGNEGSWFSGKRAKNAVGRVQRQFGDQSHVGLMMTSHTLGRISNQVYSFETRVRLSPTWFFTGQAVHSEDSDDAGRKRRGSGAYAEFLRTGRHLTYSGNYFDLSPDFRTDLGYIKRVDIRQTQHYLSYFWRPEDSPILSFGPSITAFANWDHQGVLQDLYGDAEFSIDLKGPTGFTLSRFNAFERYLGTGFRHQRTGLSFYNGSLVWLYLYGSAGTGTMINYNPGAAYTPFVGRGADASFGFTCRPSPRLKIDEIYYYTNLKTPGKSVFDNHLFRTKVNYQFTKALSARAIVDYYGVLTNPELIYQDRTKLLTGDLLLTYLLNPGTALYVGYTNRHENLAYDPSSPISLRRFGPPEFLSTAQIFVKLSYLLRF